MNLIINILYIVGAGAIIMVILNIINILQAGSKKPDGRTMEQIMGVSPDNATYDDIEKLSRSEKMQLFYAALTPEFSELNGEYKARLLSGGVLGGSSALFTHFVFPTGKLTLNTKWVGKAFKSEGSDSGTGYNIFAQVKGKKLRIRKIDTSLAPTKIGKDGRLSFQINYSRLNGGAVNSMCDEIRKINDNLYIGAGYMGLGGGPLNPAPFALIGPPTPWVGPDM